MRRRLPERPLAPRAAAGANPDRASSPYVLPYLPGARFAISRGNCSDGWNAADTLLRGTHDFLIPIGTEVSACVHLTRSGALVSVGERIERGQVIGLSGDTGSSSEPHLHFHVRQCSGCSTLPVTFLDARPHPGGLVPSDTFPFQLAYGECCRGTAVLQVDLPFQPAPEPTGVLLIAGGLLFVPRRRNR